VERTATYNPREKLSMFVLAASALAFAVGSSFALGWVIGRMLL
jgi:hypothetical protein